MFSSRARAEKGIALIIFDWFVLSMRMQVILDSSFARPGSAPIWGGKKGEFRDWTKAIPCHLKSPFSRMNPEGVLSEKLGRGGGGGVRPASYTPYPIS